MTLPRDFSRGDDWRSVAMPVTAHPSLEESVEFAENPEPRCPCVLLLDTSASMQGRPIDALNAGVQTFRENLARDPLASRRVEVAVVTYDSVVEVAQDFVTAEGFDPPTLKTRGFTFMGSAIIKALDMIEDRKALYRANGIAYYRPWVVLITDGGPQGEPDDIIRDASKRLKEAEENKRVAFFAVGVRDADMGELRKIAYRPPVYLEGLNFTDMFVWLSTSMQKLAQSKTNEEVEIDPPGTVEEQVALPRPSVSRT
jgi:uncharacterized protein YegL